MSMNEQAPVWARRLVEWYAAQRRQMPWREQPEPYRVWISEIMLQQTQVATVIPYFERFLVPFPTVESLAAAPPEAVLKAWEGLGYYSRARHLHRAAKIVVAEHGGRLPTTLDGLRELPGLGPYTAAAVASIAFGRAVPAVDGNVARVFARFWGIAADIRQAATRRDIGERLKPVLETVDPGQFNQAVMDLGATVCRPRQPRCPECPLAADCVANREDRTAELPVRAPRAKTPLYRVAVAVLWRGDLFLVGRRPADRLLGGMWELPGGKAATGESLTDALVRRVAAETGWTVTPGKTYGNARHAFSHFRIDVHVFHCAAPEGDPAGPGHTAWQWCRRADLADLPFATATRKVLALIPGVTAGN